MAFDVYDRLLEKGLAVKGLDNRHRLSDMGRELLEELDALRNLRDRPEPARVVERPDGTLGASVESPPPPKVSPRQSGLVGPHVAENS
jgi:hypothetical protein